jgi:hypothetical protein
LANAWKYRVIGVVDDGIGVVDDGSGCWASDDNRFERPL